MDTNEKVRENRLRRMAQRQGLELHKSRLRDPYAINYGTYELTGRGRGRRIFGMSLDEIEDQLTAETADERRRR